MLSKQLRRLSANTQIKQALLQSRIAPAVVTPHRNYFSMMDRVRDKLSTPLRHIRSFVEPDGMNYESQLPEGYRLHGNTAAHFSASITSNALEMHQWHEMDAVVHSQFGTIDNPVLVFTSDSSWRIVICMGPALEDESHAHEKMYYFVREGPMHRCQICGQCFKIVRLKDENSELNDYYSSMFAPIAHFEVAEEDFAVHLTNFFGDRPNFGMQTVPGTNVYIHVNNDEADRILIDPAYKLERIAEAKEKAYAMHQAYEIVDDQIKDMSYRMKVPFGRDLYESWYETEKSIMKFDRIFNRVEKFDARAMTDPLGHERREKRMLDRKRERWTQNYTYFFGNLTEEEQMYRDYFETELEMDPEDDYVEEKLDEQHLAHVGQFNPALFDFVDYTMKHDAHENFDDIVEQKLFKFKYRQNADDSNTYAARNRRMIDRHYERAKNRDPALEQNLADLFGADEKENSFAQLFTDPANYRETATEETRAFREYMMNESIQQYKDYFEDDAEEMKFFEYLDNLSNRDKIRFMEIFEDYTVDKQDHKRYVMIEKREYNPELSVLSNMALDAVDFKDRVRPLTREVAMAEESMKYQKMNTEEMLKDREEFNDMIERIRDGTHEAEQISEGYSSAEIPEPQEEATEETKKEDDE